LYKVDKVIIVWGHCRKLVCP